MEFCLACTFSHLIIDEIAFICLIPVSWWARRLMWPPGFTGVTGGPVHCQRGPPLYTACSETLRWSNILILQRTLKAKAILQNFISCCNLSARRNNTISRRHTFIYHSGKIGKMYIPRDCLKIVKNLGGHGVQWNAIFLFYRWGY